MKIFNYVKKSIEKDLKTYPELQQQIINTMMTLLKIRKLDNYDINSISMIANLTDLLYMIKKIDVKGEPLQFISLIETQKAAIVMGDANNEEAETLQKYFKTILPKPTEKTLEQYMARRLGLILDKLLNPDAVGILFKPMVAHLSIMTSVNLESFSLTSQNYIPDEKIADIIKDYLKAHEYTIRNDAKTIFKEDIHAKKSNNNITICFSNFSNLPTGKIMVSVLPY